MSSIMQQIAHRNNAVFNVGIKSNAAENPKMQYMPETMLELLSYISLPFSVQSFGLNAIMHFETIVHTSEPYIRVATAYTQTLNWMKHK